MIFYPCFIFHDFWNNFELKLTKSKFFSPRGSVEIHQNFIRNLDRFYIYQKLTIYLFD